MTAFIHKSAEVDPSAKIGTGTKIWRNSQIRENATIGKKCVIGKDVYIDHDVVIGDNCKIQNQALIYYRAEIASNVFIGPQVCFANDKIPRAVMSNGRPKKKSDWKPGYTKIFQGASIGAGSILLPGISVGKWAIVGAGSVVTKSVPNNGLVYGNPARLKGYVCPCGGYLKREYGIGFTCLRCGTQYESNYLKL